MTTQNLSALANARTIHSVVDIDWFHRFLRNKYFNDTEFTLRLFLRGINDTYLATDKGGHRYCIKLSRAHWHSRLDLSNEAAFLSHLAKSGAPVCIPYASCDQEHIETVLAPEGERHVLVTHWANGSNLRNEPSLLGAAAAGNAMATFHRASLSFSWPVRQKLSIEEDLREYRQQLYNILQPNTKHLALFNAIFDRLVGELPNCLSKFPWRPCHGDVHPGNMIIDKNSTVTLIDLDVAGQWPHCFDVASFLWSLALFGWPESHWQAFLDAYERKRKMTALERKMIPILCLARDVWHLITWARNASALGLHWFQEERIEQRLEVTRNIASLQSIDDLSCMHMPSSLRKSFPIQPTP